MMETPKKSEDNVSNSKTFMMEAPEKYEESVLDDAELMSKLMSSTTQHEQYRLIRDSIKKVGIQLTKSIAVGGVRLGMFSAAFFGLQNLIAEKRGVCDGANVVGASSATAATIVPGSLQRRARNATIGSLLGAAVCFPVGNNFGSLSYQVFIFSPRHSFW